MSQILVEDTALAWRDDVERPRHRIGRDRQSAGHGLEHDEAEGVGPAREHEHVPGGDVARQRLATQLPGEGDVGVAYTEFRQVRPVADDDLAAVEAQIEERLDVLLDGDPADEQRDRPRQREGLLAARPEEGRIDAAPPARESGEAARRKALGDGLGGDERACGSPVEATQPGIGDGQRDRHAGAHVLGKLRVEGRRERPAP